MGGPGGPAAQEAVRELDRTGRNDPCPCGSGKKFKRCHLGNESQLLDILEKRFNPDPAEVARSIMSLPACDHPRAAELAASLELTSAAGRPLSIRLVDLAAYLGLGLSGSGGQDPEALGGIFLNPIRTRTLDPNTVYLALSPTADDSTVVHQLAHILDMVEGSRLHPGLGNERSGDTGVPVELLEHPQEFGDRLLELSERLGVELDAEDEIVAFLARRKMLLPGELIAEGKLNELVEQAERTMRFMQDSKEEIDRRIARRRGYAGKGAPPKA
jgi:hypothetical protein